MQATTHFHRKLKAKLNEEIAKLSQHVANGGAGNFDNYQRMVGNIESLRTVLQLCDEIERELDD